MLLGMPRDDEEQEYALSSLPSEGEAQLAVQIGEDGLRAIDANLVRHAGRRSLKVLRVVSDAMKAGGFSLQDEACFELHLRRLVGLVEAGVLVGLGNVRRPGFSEVYLPG
jgi:hypothetical protein